MGLLQEYKMAVKVFHRPLHLLVGRRVGTVITEQVGQLRRSPKALILNLLMHRGARRRGQSGEGAWRIYRG